VVMTLGILLPERHDVPKRGCDGNISKERGAGGKPLNSYPHLSAARAVGGKSPHGIFATQMLASRDLRGNKPVCCF